MSGRRSTLRAEKIRNCVRRDLIHCAGTRSIFFFPGCLGFFLAIQNVILAALVIFFFAVYYSQVIASEERRLASIFEDDFDCYVSRVPRFWPLMKAPEPAHEILIKPKLIERGLVEVIWFLLVIIGAELLEKLHDTNALWHITLPF